MTIMPIKSILAKPRIVSSVVSIVIITIAIIITIMIIITTIVIVASLTMISSLSIILQATGTASYDYDRHSVRS